MSSNHIISWSVWRSTPREACVESAMLVWLISRPAALTKNIRTCTRLNPMMPAQGGGMSCMRKLTLVASAEDLDKASSHNSAIIAGRWSPRLIWLYRAKVLVELAGVRQARK